MWFSTFLSSPYSFSFICRVFFEKSRIPIEELRHIWQLCDVTRDGALDIAEFTSAMHLVVLRRNNIPIPSALPSCLLPNLLYKTLNLPQNEPVVPEADLLHLESDNENDNAINKNTPSDYKRMSSSTYEGRGGLEATPKSGIGTAGGGGSITIISKSSTLPKNHHSQYRLEFDDSTTTSNKINKLNNNNSSKTIIINKSVINSNVVQNSTTICNNNNITSSATNTNNNSSTKANRSTSNSPFDQFIVDESLVGQTIVASGVPATDGSTNQGAISPKSNNNKEWTKFTESPTSNVSSPAGPKPVNVTQQIVSDTHVVHPVPLRVTPVASDIVDEEALRTFRKADSLVYESGVLVPGMDAKKHHSHTHSYNIHNQRDSLPSAIQRPQPKKPASKNIGAIPPPPPQRENSFNHNDESSNVTNNNTSVVITSNNGSVILTSKKEAPPLPPPRLVFDFHSNQPKDINYFNSRPHRHTRSSSLDLQKIKLSNAQQPSQENDEDEEVSSAKPPENPPPRITDKKQFKMPSYDAYVDSGHNTNSDASFADFTQFPSESNVSILQTILNFPHLLIAKCTKLLSKHFI